MALYPFMFFIVDLSTINKGILTNNPVISSEDFLYGLATGLLAVPFRLSRNGKR
jgi:hypothetical protein